MTTASPRSTSWQRALPYLALLAGILALSFSALFVRWAQAPGTVTSFYRMAIAALALAPVVFAPPASLAQRRPVFPRGRLWLWPVLSGLFTALDHATWSTALGFTQVANATLLNNMAPLWVALFSWWVLRERLRRGFWLGLALTLAGAAVVLGSDLLLHPSLSGGNFLALFSSLFYASYFLATQRGRRYTATLVYVWLVCLGSAFFLLIINLISGQALTGYTSQTYLAFLGSALISQIIGYFSVGYALGHLPASLVSPTMIAQPVLTALLAIVLVGEALAPGQWLGGLTVLAGIYLVNRSREA